MNRHRGCALPAGDREDGRVAAPERLSGRRGRAGQTEPDARFSLANERTFLAYVRTSLGLIAGAVAVAALGERVQNSAWRYVVAAVLLLLGLVNSVVGYLRWRAVEVAMRTDQPIPVTGYPRLLAAGLVVVCIAAAVLIGLGL
jgi:putative membrane protein